MLRTEISEVMEKDGKMFDIAQKSTYNLALTSEEKEIAEICDAWVKEVAEKGDSDREISAFVKRTVNDEIYNYPDELLDQIFDRGSVGEFDDYYVEKSPKNTLVAHESAKGGTVDKSWVDFSKLTPTWKNRQIEFEIPYVELRRGGWKTLALLSNYAVEAFRNAQFSDIFTMVDGAITGSEQAIAETTSKPTQTSMDALALYLTDRDPNAVAVTLTKYAQAIGRMTGYSSYMSEAMKNDFNRYGLVKFFDGVGVAGISSAKKVNGSNLLIPDKKIFGVAGKIGVLDQKGEIHVYQDFDNANEKLVVRLKDFQYGYTITKIDNVAKVTMAS
jgi:hypothetical protein